MSEHLAPGVPAVTILAVNAHPARTAVATAGTRPQDEPLAPAERRLPPADCRLRHHRLDRHFRAARVAARPAGHRRRHARAGGRGAAADQPVDPRGRHRQPRDRAALRPLRATAGRARLARALHRRQPGRHRRAHARPAPGRAHRAGVRRRRGDVGHARDDPRSLRPGKGGGRARGDRDRDPDRADAGADARRPRDRMAGLARRVRALRPARLRGVAVRGAEPARDTAEPTGRRDRRCVSGRITAACCARANTSPSSCSAPAWSA